MELGGFGRIEDYDCISRSGFDYAELDVPEIETLPEKEFEIFCGKVREMGFPVLAGARALPAAEPYFFTESFRLLEYRQYLENACRRAEKLGITKIIFGNGRARSLIDGSSIKKESRFIDFIRMFAEIAGNRGVELIIEPLGPEYSNYINTLPEAVRLIREAGVPNIYTMVDLRHMFRGGEPYSDIAEYAEYIHHVHIDYPLTYPERHFPKADDGFDYTKFLNAVTASGCGRAMTIEADVPEDWMTAAGGVRELLNKCNDVGVKSI